MRKRLQIALMASTVAATSLSLTSQLRAAEGGEQAPEKITATDEHGRKVYVNESVPAGPAHPTQTSPTPRRKLRYWGLEEKSREALRPPDAAIPRAAPAAAEAGKPDPG